ncbi:MAG: MarR family winged helix-turn-helix transcriptional regulator [Acidimicrobiales bacterium]
MTVIERVAQSDDTTLPEGLEAGIGFRLSRVARVMRSDWAAELTNLGLTPPQVALLRALSDDPGCSLRHLSRRLGTDPMSAKRCADELENRGLIRSAHRGGDRRPRSLEVTAQGAVMASKVEGMVASREDHLSQVLGEHRRKALIDALGVLEDHLGLPADAARQQRPGFPLPPRSAASGAPGIGSQEHPRHPLTATGTSSRTRPSRLRKELT